MSPPWMPLYIADYLADTGELSTLEHGAYLLLIMSYWQKGGLPNDDAKLARIARLSTSQWKAVRGALAPFFDEHWRHKRIEAEIVEAAKKIEKRSQAGKAGGLASGRTRSKNEANVEQSFNDRSTIVEANDQRSLKQTRSKHEAKTNQPQPPSPSKKDAEAIASDAGASPVFTDLRHQLCHEGPLILESLGKSADRSRAMIGKWLKDCGDRPEMVLGAIQRARDHRSGDPFAFVTGALRTDLNGNIPHHTRGKSAASDFFAGIASVAADIDRHGQFASRREEDIPRGRVEIDG